MSHIWNDVLYKGKFFECLCDGIRGTSTEVRSVVLLKSLFRPIPPPKYGRQKLVKNLVLEGRDPESKDKFSLKRTKETNGLKLPLLQDLGYLFHVQAILFQTLETIHQDTMVTTNFK